jgi:HK97 family phage major capsid protein
MARASRLVSFDETNGGTVAKTLTGTKLGTDDVLDLVYALKRPYRKKASFIMNDQTLAALRKLKDNNGAYIWQPSYQAGRAGQTSWLCGSHQRLCTGACRRKACDGLW